MEMGTLYKASSPGVGHSTMKTLQKLFEDL